MTPVDRRDYSGGLAAEIWPLTFGRARLYLMHHDDVRDEW